jgi:hypothetical protein
MVLAAAWLGRRCGFIFAQIIGSKSRFRLVLRHQGA